MWTVGEIGRLPLLTQSSEGTQSSHKPHSGMSMTTRQQILVDAIDIFFSLLYHTLAFTYDIMPVFLMVFYQCLHMPLLFVGRTYCISCVFSLRMVGCSEASQIRCLCSMCNGRLASADFTKIFLLSVLLVSAQ